MATSTIKDSVGASIYSLGNLTLPATLNVPSDSRSVIFMAGPYSGKGHAVITVACNTSGTVYPTVIGGTVTPTGGTNTLTLSDASDTISNTLVMTYSGGRITV